MKFCPSTGEGRNTEGERQDDRQYGEGERRYEGEERRHKTDG